MTTPLLSRAPYRTGPALSPAPQVALALGRAHEACGMARRGFALWLASAAQGPLYWVSPTWQEGALTPDGIARWLSPARLTMVAAPRPQEVLWALEEVCRAGVIPMVVGDLPAPPSLTAVRRLHLACEEGAAKAAKPPLCLLLTPGDGGCPGVETRWRMEPRHAGPQEAWEITRLRARTAPPEHWHATREATSGAAGLTLTRLPTSDTPPTHAGTPAQPALKGAQHLI